MKGEGEPLVRSLEGESKNGEGDGDLEVVVLGGCV